MQNQNQSDLLSNTKNWRVVKDYQTSEQIFKPNFLGYWRDINKWELPQESGLFCVYECFHDPYKDKVYLSSLIFIGESDNVNRSVISHENRKEWSKFVKPGYELCYSYCALEPDNRKRIAAALVFLNKPLANKEYRNYFPYPKTIINATGQTTILREKFVANMKA